MDAVLCSRDYIVTAELSSAVSYSVTRSLVVNPQVQLPRPHAALLLNAGIDNTFGDWGPTLELLARKGTPCAFTGYLPSCEAGCERLLRFMGWDILSPTAPNPFGLSLPDSPHVRDGFLVVARGKNDRKVSCRR